MLMSGGAGKSGRGVECAGTSSLFDESRQVDADILEGLAVYQVAATRVPEDRRRMHRSTGTARAGGFAPVLEVIRLRSVVAAGRWEATAPPCGRLDATGA